MKKLLALLVLLGCSNPEQQEESFTDFYQRFHTDSEYQLERIVFPLEGLPPFADAIERYYWQEEEWQIHKPFNNKEFEQEFIYLDQSVVIEQFINDDVGMSRTFANFDNRWYLIKYDAINYIN